MKKSSRIIWGIILIVAGIAFGLKIFGLLEFDIFFDGWWTLFLIIPGIVGLITRRDIVGNVICLSIGVLLLLACRGIIDFQLLGKLIVPAVIIGIGAKLIYNSIKGKAAEDIIDSARDRGEKLPEGYATFSGCNMNFDGEEFLGCELCAAFGGVKCDLRGAVIEKDAAIKVTAVFGGVDIIVPEGINVKVSSTSVFGGVSNKSKPSSDPAAPTLYINGLCLFGGCEIK
ncbi:MAG: hypothetical protein IKJ13_05300 [Clostridia bacterium]|nr:hypothetical protein [Clostridia bacterium]